MPGWTVDAQKLLRHSAPLQRTFQFDFCPSSPGMRAFFVVKSFLTLPLGRLYEAHSISTHRPAGPHYCGPNKDLPVFSATNFAPARSPKVPFPFTLAAQCRWNRICFVCVCVCVCVCLERLMTSVFLKFYCDCYCFTFERD